MILRYIRQTSVVTNYGNKNKRSFAAKIAACVVHIFISVSYLIIHAMHIKILMKKRQLCLCFGLILQTSGLTCGQAADINALFL